MFYLTDEFSGDSMTGLDVPDVIWCVSFQHLDLFFRALGVSVSRWNVSGSAKIFSNLDLDASVTILKVCDTVFYFLTSCLEVSIEIVSFSVVFSRSTYTMLDLGNTDFDMCATELLVSVVDLVFILLGFGVFTSLDEPGTYIGGSVSGLHVSAAILSVSLSDFDFSCFVWHGFVARIIF